MIAPEAMSEEDMRPIVMKTRLTTLLRLLRTGSEHADFGLTVTLIHVVGVIVRNVAFGSPLMRLQGDQRVGSARVIPLTGPSVRVRARGE